MGGDVLDDPTGTREEIIAATVRSLQRHGYVDLTIGKISDEFEKSQSLIYHHFDGKDDLVLEALKFVLEEYRVDAREGECRDPRDRLEDVLDTFLSGDPDERQRRSLATLYELRTQAIHDETFREHFTRSDAVFEEIVAAIVREGVDRGDFQDCDPEAVAATIQTIVNGALLRRATTTSEEWIPKLRSQIDAYLRRSVYAG